MAKEGLSASIKVSGLYQTLGALSRMPENAKSELKDAAFDLSQMLAKNIRVAARAAGSQSGLMAGTVSTGTDVSTSGGVESNLPQVQAGGSSRVGRHKKPAYKVLFGSEFGAVRYTQFKPANPIGYWFFPTVDALSDEVGARWTEAADLVIAKFADE